MSYFRSLSLFTKLLLLAFLGLIVIGLAVEPPDELPAQSTISELQPRAPLAPSVPPAE